MRIYHRTFHSAAILQEGFRDTTGTYMTGYEFTGVWVSDIPLDENEGADGDVLLALDIPEEIFVKYEWVEAEKPYRESLIPAKILNSLGSLEIVDDSDFIDPCFTYPVF